MTAESEQVDYTYFSKLVLTQSVSIPGTFSFLSCDDLLGDRQGIRSVKARES